jgi:hypothetical protein
VGRRLSEVAMTEWSEQQRAERYRHRAFATRRSSARWRSRYRLAFDHYKTLDRALTESERRLGVAQKALEVVREDRDVLVRKLKNMLAELLERLDGGRVPDSEMRRRVIEVLR